MSEILGLTAAQAAERVHAGDLERGELWRFYRDRALADDLNAFTWVCEGDDPEAQSASVKEQLEGISADCKSALSG